MYKQGDQHVVIGVVSFSSSPPTDASNLNLLSFESLFGWKEKCGEGNCLETFYRERGGFD